MNQECTKCFANQPLAIITSQSTKNPNRNFYKCQVCTAFMGWVDETTELAGQSRKRKRIETYPHNTDNEIDNSIQASIDRIYDLLNERLPVPCSEPEFNNETGSYPPLAPPKVNIPSFKEMINYRNK